MVMLVVSMPSMFCSLGAIWPINIMDRGPRAITKMPVMIGSLQASYPLILQLSDKREVN